MDAAFSFKAALAPHLDAIYRTLSAVADMGPFDGGCLACANALQSVIGGQVVVLTRVGTGQADHAAVELDGKLFDLDGAAAPQQFIERFERNEGVRISGYRPIAPGDLPDAPTSPTLERALTKIMRKAIPVRECNGPATGKKPWLVSIGRFVGPVVDVKNGYVVQKIAPEIIVAHKVSDFNELPECGASLDVQYRAGKAVRMETQTKDSNTRGR